jgi:hypothetical protein
MERVEIEGQVATAHTMAMLFSAIPPSRSGPTDIFIVDIHALQERFYFDPRSSVVSPISAIELFVGHLLDKCANAEFSLSNIVFCGLTAPVLQIPCSRGRRAYEICIS